MEMAFDWVMAAIRICREQPKIVSAVLDGDPLSETIIYRDGKPVLLPALRVRIASKRFVPMIRIDGKIEECWVDTDLIPESQTQWWPMDARAILEGA